jgi:hypothetical protein
MEGELKMRMQWKGWNHGQVEKVPRGASSNDADGCCACCQSVRASACHTSRARWATRCPTTSPATFRAHSLGFISYDLWGQGGTDPPVPSPSSLRRQSFSWSLSVGSDNLAGKNRIGKHEFHRNKHFLFKSTLIWV